MMDLTKTAQADLLTGTMCGGIMDMLLGTGNDGESSFEFSNKAFFPDCVLDGVAEEVCVVLGIEACDGDEVCGGRGWKRGREG